MMGMGSEMREVSTGELPALFSMLASTKYRRFFVRIPDTVFLNPEGVPVAKLSTRVYDGQAMVMKWSQEELAGATLRSVAQEVGDYKVDPKVPPPTKEQREEMAKTPSAVARFANTNRLLTQSELDALLDDIAAGRLPRQETPHGHVPEVPYCVQQHISPGDGLRYVTTYLWSDTHIVCESMAGPHAKSYGGGAAGRPGTASAAAGLGYTAVTAEDTAVQLRHSTLGVVQFIKRMHGCQLLGLVVEHVRDAAGHLWLTMVLGVCWPEMWHRQRVVQPAGLFQATLPVVPAALYPEPRAQSAGAVPEGGASTESPPRRAGSARGGRRAYGLGSTLAAVVASQPGAAAKRTPAPRLTHSLPGIAAARHGCGVPVTAAKEALAAARDVVLAAAAAGRPGGSSPTFAPYGLTSRPAEQPLVAQLTRRLEATRDELQSQCHAAAACGDRARRAEESAAQAALDRSAAVRDLEALDSRYGAEAHAWGARLAELQLHLELATAAAAQKALELGAACDEKERLKTRIDFERDVAFDVTGDLRARLDATMADNAELKRVQGLHATEKRTLTEERDALRQALADLQAEVDKAERERGAMKDESSRNKQALVDHEKMRTYLPHVTLRSVVGSDEISDILRMDAWPLFEHFCITGLFAAHGPAVKEVFGHYANIRDYVGDKRGLQELMGWPEFTVFCRECFGFEQVVVDQLFVKANFNTGTVSTGNARLEFGEFLEVLVRLAQLRSPNLACSSDRVRELLEKVIEPVLKRVRAEKREQLMKGGRFAVKPPAGVAAPGNSSIGSAGGVPPTAVGGPRAQQRAGSGRLNSLGTPSPVADFF